MSSGPAASTARRQSSVWLTSPTTKFGEIDSNGAWRRPITVTTAPSAIMRVATAAPIPVPPPVISARLPSNRISGLPVDARECG